MTILALLASPLAACWSSGAGAPVGQSAIGSAGGGDAGEGGSWANGAGGAGAGGQPGDYPTRSAYRIKGLQPDFVEPTSLEGNNVGGVLLNFPWWQWEVTQDKHPPCGPNDEEYDGRCFEIKNQADLAVRDWTAQGTVVTAVLLGTTSWEAIDGCPLDPKTAACAPKDPSGFARFAGMLARRYDGKHGHGRIADFVIGSMANHSDGFNVGCGPQTRPCVVSEWVGAYAAVYSAAYDAITAAQPYAKVLVSIDNRFATPDALGDDPPAMSGVTFLTQFAASVGSRAWRVAYPPYTKDPRSAAFSAEDYPYVTLGNIGVLAGWLRQTFPDRPSAWEIQLTGSGLSSGAPESSPEAQAAGLCAGFRNVLGTPGIESFIYHRMIDFPDEGYQFGLRDETGAPKPAFDVWANANLDAIAPAALSCGFEELPYVRLTRSANPGRGHWASTRARPDGFADEPSDSFRLLRDPDPAQPTAMLYECAVRHHNMISKDPYCEGRLSLGPVGYVYTTAQPGTVPLYRCSVGAAEDHDIASTLSCNGMSVDGLLGYALP